jgi:CHAT domain-containing protein
VVYANPTFGEPEPIVTAKLDNKVIQAKHSVTAKRASVTIASDMSEVYFAPLAGTASEAHAIKSLFNQAKVLIGKQATESSLKQVSAPDILHIATHGFFLIDSPNSSEINGHSRSINSNVKIQNPLLRSGLAFAGANLHHSKGDDGILTALEASGLNLWGTKLVTLSACDTGLGEVKNGEGVYGLRRAFVLAGAESLVMSLWGVNDYVTRAMMTNYYKGLKNGLGRGEALRQVQLNMLKDKRRQHPYYWASFIQSGEWTNL